MSSWWDRLHRWDRWLWLVLLTVGIVSVVIGAVMSIRTVQFQSRAESATGTIVDHVFGIDADGEVTYRPVIRFTTAGGEVIQFVSPDGSASPDETLGDTVEVRYDPDDPSDARQGGFIATWLGPILLLGVGAAFVGAGWFLRRTYG